MRLAILVFVSLVVFPFSAFSQGYDQLKTQLQFENFYGAKARAPRSAANVTGSEYLAEAWIPMEITFASGTAQFNQGKLNLLNSSAEVMYKEKEMFISPDNFKTIKLLNQERWFLPATKFYYKDMAMQGMFETFEASPTYPFVMLQHYVYLREPSTNGYVSGGSTEKKLMKASALFLHDGTRLNPIRGKKDLEKIFVKDKAKFDRLRKEMGTNFKDAKSVHQLVAAMKAG